MIHRERVPIENRSTVNNAIKFHNIPQGMTVFEAMRDLCANVFVDY